MTSRTTISVPIGLKRRMESVDGVNWSRVAAKAFEAELRKHESEDSPNLPRYLVIEIHNAPKFEF